MPAPRTALVASAALLRAGFERLSDESRYRRFLTPMPRPTEAALCHLIEIDHRDHEALITVVPASGAVVAVGSPRYDRPLAR